MSVSHTSGILQDKKWGIAVDLSNTPFYTGKRRNKMRDKIRMVG